MAKDIGDLIVKLSLDSTKFDDGIKRLESQMTKVQALFTSSTSGLTNFGKVVDSLQGSAKTLTQRLATQKQQVAQLEKAYQDSVRTKGADAAETQKLADKLEKAKTKVAATEKALTALNAQIKLNQNGWYQLGMNLDGLGKKLQTAGKSMSDAGKKLSLTVTTPLVALGATAVKSGIEFESAFAGVRKTVDASEAEFKDLSDSIKAMSERIPASTTELSGIMEMAGQLGVKGSDDLKKFTETIAALGVSTNLTREDAATMLAQFANIKGMPIDEIDKLGSVIVALGNNFATTEADIVQMGMRLAGAGTQLGMSEAQIMAFATALSSVGIEAEAGGSAFSKLMVSMKVAAETGIKGKEVIQQTGMSLRDLQLLADQDASSFKDLAAKLGLTSEELKGFMASASDLDNFAKVTGMTAQQFAKAYGEDAAGALMKFLQGLNSIEANGGSAIVTLDEMGLTEVRLRDAILRASGATELFGKAQETANTAWTENVALTNEASQRYGTTESQLTMLKNSANNLAIQFSEVMIPVLMRVVEKLRGVIEWLQGLSTEQKETIVKVAAFAAALGPVLLVLGKITSAVGTFMRILAPLAKALGGAQASTGLLGTAFSALTGPVGIVVAAIAGLVAIFVTLYKNNEEFRAKMDALWAQICAAVENVKAVFEKAFARLKAAMEPVKEALSKLWESVQRVFLQIWNLIEPIVTAIGVLLGGLVATVVSVVAGIINALGPLIEAIINAVDFVTNIVGIVIALINGDFSGAWEMAKSALSSFFDFFVNLLTGIGAFFEGCWESICAIASAFGVDLSSFFSGLWESIKTGAATAWNGITAWLGTAWASVKETASTAWSAVCTAVSDAVTAGKEWIATAWDTVSTAVSAAWETVKTGATTTWQAVCTAVSDAVTAGKEWIATAWGNVSTAVSGAWETVKAGATTAWNAVCSNASAAVAAGQSIIKTAWDNVSTAVSGVWDTAKSTASSAWAAVCTNVKSAVDTAKSGIQTAWSTITTGISSGWNLFKSTASTAWSTITTNVKTTISGAQAGIVSAWENIKSGIKSKWDTVTEIFKSPIEAASTWLSQKVEWLKGLFSFEWKLPSFKLPKIDVNWKEIGWGIKIPTLSLNWNALGGVFNKPTIFNTANAGLQGVGEAGPEAILPLDTLWQEMSARLKAGMREILLDMNRDKAAQENAMVQGLLSALRLERGEGRQSTSVQVTQHIYANETSYAGQQREAARNFRLIAREMG